MTTTHLERTVRLAATGDTTAYETLVHRYANLVASVALGVVRNVPASEDVAQDVFVTAWVRLHQLEDPARFPAWLRQITRNRATEYLRGTQRDRRVAAATRTLPQAPEPSAEALALSAEQELRLATALEDLPDSTRDVLVLYYREGKRLDEVARLLDITPVAARKRLSRARERLREEVRTSEALRRTAPGAVFVAAVLAALPSTPAHAASLRRATPRVAGLALGAAALTLLAATQLPHGLGETSHPLPPPPETSSLRTPALVEPEEPVAPTPDTSWPPPPASPYQEALFAYAEAGGLAVVNCDPAELPAFAAERSAAVLDEGRLWTTAENAFPSVPVMDEDGLEAVGWIRWNDAHIGSSAPCHYVPNKRYGTRQAYYDADYVTEGGIAHPVPPGFAVAMEAYHLRNTLTQSEARADVRVAAVDVALETDVSDEARAYLLERREALLASHDDLLEHLEALDPSEEAMHFVEAFYARGGFDPDAGVPATTFRLVPPP